MSKEEKNWGIVELMGHKVVAGMIQKSEMLGKPMLRVDIPETSAYPAFTQFYGEAAIYCVTFTSKEIAKAAAESYKVNPISVYAPELITIERHLEVVNQLKQVIYQMRALPEPPEEDTEDEEIPRPPIEETGIPF